jgi:predicted RNase H-like nuclease/cytidine deaminase
MTTTFIGVDLAWKSERNPSGIAVMEGDRSGVQLTTISTLEAEASVLDFILHSSTTNTIVAIDAPLIINNETGQRACESEVGRRYGNRDASCHTTNLTLYSDAASVALTTALLTGGFAHVDPATRDVSGKLVAEVYPHAAMVALWDLPKVIKYKKGSLPLKRAGLEILTNYIRRLHESEPQLLSNGLIRDVLGRDLNGLGGDALKRYEDQLDAIFCAYQAYYFWYWGWERNEIFGTLAGGYILNPTLQPLDHKSETTPDTSSNSNLRLVKNEPNSDTTTASSIRNDSEVFQRSREPSSPTLDYSTIITQAHKLARPIRPSNTCSAGTVGSVIISRSGQTYTGICLDFESSLGFCAEHAAIAEMLKAHESEIAVVVAVTSDGAVLPPCGRCREMMWQLNSSNKHSLVILAPDDAVPLADLLPFR